MDCINNNVNFRSLNYSKNTKRLLEARGEWGEFEKIIPDMTRKAKNTNIRFDVQQMGPMRTTLSCEIRPKNTLLSNPITRALGLAKKQYSGDSYYPLNDKFATEKLFRGIYRDAYNEHRGNANLVRKGIWKYTDN